VDTISISIEEAVRLGALNSELFNHVFFPKSFRQKSPPFHKQMDSLMDDPRARYVEVVTFRGSAKTTKLRAFTAKRIAYGLSRTVLYIGASESHAIRSIQWLRNQVDRNKKFADTFGLKPGRKWQENEAEIQRTIDGNVAWILGVGITGNLRGINFDDYRPDLIVLDDPITDENASTLDQREKVINLILGAVKESLTPATEEPNAKMVMSQTPINPEDATSEIARDPQWKTLVCPCWTLETADLHVDDQLSVWEERFPTAILRQEKKASINRGRYSIWAREMECKLITAEQAPLRPNWLQVRPTPRMGLTIIAIDPVPPPSEAELARGLKRKNYEVILALRKHAGDYDVVHYEMNRGHEPNWTCATALQMAHRFGASRICVEAVGYQRTLEYILRQEMRKRGVYFALVPVTDKRKKFHRIVTTLSGIAAEGHLFCAPHHSELRGQWAEYRGTDPDDILDALAIGVMDLDKLAIDGEGPIHTLDESMYEELKFGGGAP
jgi:hypothetical protein